MSEENLNPIARLYESIEDLLNNMTIKYSYTAETNETLESKQAGDGYIDACEQKDTFLTYRDYTTDDYAKAGIIDATIISNGLSDVRTVPLEYQSALLAVRRQREIDEYVEANNYYRMLYGLPDVDEDPINYFFLDDETAKLYGIDATIPIHAIQDYYNAIESGEGTRLINVLEGIGLISELATANTDKPYLKYIGSSRISIIQSRTAKNFEIIQLSQGDIKKSIYDEFVLLYEQCREYTVAVIFNTQFRDFIPYYDNYTAMCIMVMTINQLVMRQIPLGIKRDFYDIYAIKMLYEVYGIPYNLYINEDTQKSIAQNLNVLIQNKATNKVIYDVADLLGYTNIDVYKYYLTKERQFDIYGVPIVAYTTKFNTDTGEIETVPDYEKMYDIYFQKADLQQEDFVNSFDDKVNRLGYEDVISNDPYWWQDENTYKRVWETDYNFVESKYLGLGISYKMTDLVFENILLLKMLIDQNSPLKSVTITLPKIIENTDIPLFDVIILLICLVSKKHSLKGEIISIPTQVISVLDYMRNTEDGGKYLVDSLSFNFELFEKSNKEGQAIINSVKSILGTTEATKFESYISTLSIDANSSNADKIKAINNIYSNIKGLESLISYAMTDANDRESYEALKTFYRAAYYSKEVRDIFNINGELTGVKRTSSNFFEFLYHYNPKLYSAVFEFDEEEQYTQYLSDNSLTQSSLSYNDFRKQVENGDIELTYDTLIETSKEDENATDDLIYYYVNHIISRIKTIITNLNFIYLLNDTATPLEELLVKLVRFFKSHTIDLIGLDIIYVCNLKAENMLRLIDEINYMKKIINPNEEMNISYSDVIGLISTKMQQDDENKLTDLMVYDAVLYVCNRENLITMEDKAHLVSVEETLFDESGFFYDAVNKITSVVTTNDSNKFSDRIIKTWFTD